MTDLVVNHSRFHSFNILSSILFVFNQVLDPISFFSVQLSEDLQVAHDGTVVFDSVVVNYGSDYIQTGGIYM